MKPGDLVRVKKYFRHAEQGPGGTHGIVIEVEDAGDLVHRPLGQKYLIVEVLVADGFFNHYSARNLEVLSEAG